jgi:hypothetical protein
VELWPASRPLDQWLASTRRSGGPAVLDLGCGLGSPPWWRQLGAGCGPDYEPAALRYAVGSPGQRRARAAFACMDWRAPALRPGWRTCAART